MSYCEEIFSTMRDIQIGMVPNHDLEHDLSSLKELQERWQSSSDQEFQIAADSMSLSSFMLLDHTQETNSVVTILA